MTTQIPRDEMVDGQGGLRPHWRGVLAAFSAMGEGGLATRARRLDRAFEEEGIASVLPGAAGRPWRCDPVPLPLAASEFAVLQEGLAQRARLLALVLQDIYGPQTLLAEGKLPPALVYANPGFLRACRIPGHVPLLHSYAADLIRAPDGTWHVWADRTASTGGIGYAQENRRLLARVLPEAFRPLQVRQLRPFFDLWQDSLRRLGPAGQPNPTVALLTPGNAAPQWFEHMFLARELSCALVEGGDLTVRGGALYLKTLKGLQQVDVLLRRLDGRMIDPLELEPGSLLGVPGLVDTLRQGSVRIANDPGSGVAEAPALAAFLPALCQRLLGEKLLLPGVPTLWLGDPAARAVLQANPGGWRVAPALDSTVPPVLPMALSEVARGELMARIEARPWEWAATASLPPSVAPCLDGRGLTPRPVLLRLFLVADGAEWQAMPGGLARVLEDPERLTGRRPEVGVSKDVWVLSEERGMIMGPPALSVPALKLRRPSGDLPSRVADNMFWLGRYVERLDRAARLMRSALQRLTRGTGLLPRELLELQMLGRCLAEAGLVPPEAAPAETLGEALLASVRDGGAVAGLFASVARLTESVRDRLTDEMYATFTATLRAARGDAAAAGRSLDGLTHGMVGITRFATAVAGVAAENMVRGGGWMFLELGRRLERGWAVAGQVSLALDQPPSRIEAGLRLLLEICDSVITYRSRYLDVLQPAPVLDLVLVDQGNPRGLGFQLTQMHGLLDELSSTAGLDVGAANANPREMLAGAAAGLLAEVEIMVEMVLAASDQAAAAASLPSQLRGVEAGVAALSDRITRRYFALLPAVQTLGWSPGEVPVLRGAA
ncbi:Circularly permuted type 2 ATP-grasp protein [Rhodovastum atsumiense]|uniref:Circularly permuted type 2 ATP-grasp protein n=1 Tax=Rhodovastum atsumiense TaxID=504468 RepID=A0A5M6ILD8_9PROT|nr:circularly permuted type 2 ATP-grasp protein [Rhodovastum atsumiense]KAA5609054.1 circularly permuted type 2 ATP-grasp protein [Rhodovastum atsumiense]CAH2604697.1 Circularly permuted type 2 ATP-grasp protein [Rhodovastum atsumiense]